MRRFQSRAIIAATTLLIAATGAALSQNAPSGACELPDGSWCWPLTPATFGDDCQCPTPDGLKWGIIQ